MQFIAVGKTKRDFSALITVTRRDFLTVNRSECLSSVPVTAAAVPVTAAAVPVTAAAVNVTAAAVHVTAAAAHVTAAAVHVTATAAHVTAAAVSPLPMPAYALGPHGWTLI